MAGAGDYLQSQAIRGLVFTVNDKACHLSVDDPMLRFAAPRRRQMAKPVAQTPQIPGKPAKPMGEHIFQTRTQPLPQNGCQPGGGDGDSDRITIDDRTEIETA